MEENKLKNAEAFVKYVKACHDKGMSEAETARSLGIKTSEYRCLRAKALNVLHDENRKGG